ncbi:hypothetical protein ACW5WY_11745 [Aeromonas aquatica]
MNEFYEFSLRVFEEFPQLFIITTSLIVLCHYLIIKKQTYSFLDPLCMFVCFNSFAMVTVFFVSVFRKDVTIFIDLAFFNFLFFLPGLLIKPIKLNQFRVALLSLRTQPEYMFFTFNAAIFIFSTIILWVVKGIPIFSEDPSYAKVAIYQNGFGIIRYIHFVLPIYLTMYSFMDLILSERKKTSISYMFSTFILLFCFVFFIFSSAKTSILWALFSFALINEVFSNNRYYKRINKIKLILFIFSIGIVFLILMLSDTRVGGDVLERLFVLLGVRLLASGDALFFWYNFDLSEKMSSINILEYLFSPLMGMFGISSHEYSLGVSAMNVATGFPLGAFGPNAQLPLVLGLAFGPFRFFMAFFAGCLLFYFRNYTHLLIKKMGGGGQLFLHCCSFTAYIYILI